MQLTPEQLEEAEDVLSELSDAANNSWVQNRADYARGVMLADWDRDSVGWIDADLLNRVLPVLRQLLSEAEVLDAVDPRW